MGGECAQAGTGYCLNDWNAGGPGTAVRMYTAGTSNDDLNFIFLTGYCNNGMVTDGTEGQPGPACPFRAGTGMNSTYFGDLVFALQLVNFGAGDNYCVGTDSSARVNVGPCPPAKGGTGSNLWVQGPPCSSGGHSGNYLINVYWSNFYGSPYYLISGGSVGAQATVGSVAESCWA